MITLRLADLTLQLNPDVGGSVAKFLRGDTPILRTAQAGSTSALDQAAYPLIPFSGRIDQGKFNFNNRQVTLPSNMPPEPHAIHGQGWQSPWQVVTQCDHAATIALDYPGTDWPWRYRATQTFELKPDGLRVALSIHNRATEPMPAGLGWHPFFPKDDATLAAEVGMIWPSGNDLISQTPIHGPEVMQLTKGALVTNLDLDNAFSTRKPQAKIHWAKKAQTVLLQASSELAHLVIYTPPGENFFCVEPVSHAPNCLNSSLPASITGARTLAAGATMHSEITLELS